MDREKSASLRIIEQMFGISSSGPAKAKTPAPVGDDDAEPESDSKPSEEAPERYAVVKQPLRALFNLGDDSSASSSSKIKQPFTPRIVLLSFLLSPFQHSCLVLQLTCKKAMMTTTTTTMTKRLSLSQLQQNRLPLKRAVRKRLSLNGKRQTYFSVVLVNLIVAALLGVLLSAVR